MHPTQKRLLSRLKAKNKQRFASLTKGYTADDNILFHLKQLIKRGLIKKRDLVYSITPAGIRTIAQFDSNNFEEIKPKIFYLGFLCELKNEVLLKEHLSSEGKFYNLPSGKPAFGEKIGAALSRIFKKGSGIKINPSRFAFDSLHLKTVRTRKGEVLFDDAFAVYRIEITSKERVEMKLKHGWRWFNKERISRLGKIWPEINYCVFRKNWRP